MNYSEVFQLYPVGTINTLPDAFTKAKSITTSNASVASEPKSNLMLISPGTAQENLRETNKQNQHSSEHTQP